MDAIITTVDWEDKNWKKELLKFSNSEYGISFFYDWGFVPFIIKGIRKFMPFINNIYIVTYNGKSYKDEGVYSISHHDIIPEKLLPTFSSCCIEMFLHKINGLDEYYIYFNDDMIPVYTMQEDFFIKDGKILSDYKNVNEQIRGLYRNNLNNGCKLVGTQYFRPSHNPHCYSKSLAEECFSKYETDIIKSCRFRFRHSFAYNQYLFEAYQHAKGVVEYRADYSKIIHVSKIDDLESVPKLLNESKSFVCFNDYIFEKNCDRSIIVNKLNELLSNYFK